MFSSSKGGSGIYVFKPLPVPPPYKQHWERKIEEEDLFTKEAAICSAAKEASVEFSKCSHSESMFDEGSGICMSCGVFMGLCFAPLSANTSGIPGAHHHAFSSATTSSATRKKKIVAAAAAEAAGMIIFDSVVHPSSSSYLDVAEDDAAKSSDLSTATTTAAVFPLFYEGQKVVIFNGTIPVYEPKPFVFLRNRNETDSLQEQKKRAFVAYMFQISEEAFGKIFNSESSSSSSSHTTQPYHPLDNIITTGIYSFTGYGFCRHSVGYVNSLAQPSSNLTSSKRKKMEAEKGNEFTTSCLNKQIIEAIPSIIASNFEFYASKRRRTQISLFVAVVTAHIKVVHGRDVDSIQECLDIQRLRAKVKASLISKETQSSFYHAIGARLGIDSKCSGRLVQDAYEMYIGGEVASISSSSPHSCN